MKINLLLISLFLLLVSPRAFVLADSYDGPDCAVEKNPSCKLVSHIVAFSLDKTMSDYSFCTIEYNDFEDYSTNSTVFITATTSRFEIINLSGTCKHCPDNDYLIGHFDNSDMSLLKDYADSFGVSYSGNLFGKGLSIGPISSTTTELLGKLKEHLYYGSFAVLATPNVRIPRIFYLENYLSKYEHPGTSGYYPDTEFYAVPITSPITKVIEYWTIKKAPSGMIYKEKTKIESYLDNGHVDTEIFNKDTNIPASNPTSTTASTSTNTYDAPQESLWSRIANFFRNLF